MKYQIISPLERGSSLVEQILLNRGVAEPKRYLNPTKEEVLDPLLLANMEKSSAILLKHIENNDNLFVQIDEDLDGYSSASLLINYLYKVFPEYTKEHIFYAPHKKKEHGLDIESIPETVKLVLIPDAGSNEFVKHKELFDRGIDVCIYDHHIAPSASEWACVINNQLCDYPNKSLSGVGIVYKFCSYLDNILGHNYAPEFCDLVSIGMIADMVDLRPYETRWLLKTGMGNPQNRFIQEMIKKNSYQMKDELTPHNISWFIAPAVNAVARVGTYEERVLLFEAMLDFHAEDLIPSTKRGAKGSLETKVEQAVRNCGNIRNRQNKDRDAGIEYIDELIQEKNLLDAPLLIVCLEQNDFNPNIIGLMANQVAAKYNKPTLVLRKEEGYWKGSGRNIRGTTFENFQQYLLSTGLVEMAQGHENAFGVEIAEDKIEELRERAKEELAQFDFSAIYKVDIEVPFKELSDRDILAITDLKDIWGQEIDEPLLAVTEVKINKSNYNILKNNTVKINREDGLSLMMFKVPEEQLALLDPKEGYVELTVVGKCSCNEWNGNITPQLIVEDFEITKREEFYF